MLLFVFCFILFLVCLFTPSVLFAGSFVCLMCCLFVVCRCGLLLCVCLSFIVCSMVCLCVCCVLFRCVVVCFFLVCWIVCVFVFVICAAWHALRDYYIIYYIMLCRKMYIYMHIYYTNLNRTGTLKRNTILCL